MTNDTRPPFTPLNFWNAYPCDVDKPLPSETGQEFAARCTDVGDTLLTFLVNELFEENIDRREMLNRLNTVVNEINRVINAVRA